MNAPRSADADPSASTSPAGGATGDGGGGITGGTGGVPRSRREGRMTRATITTLLLLLIGALSYIAINEWRDARLQNVRAEDSAFAAEVMGRSLVPVDFEVDVPEDTPADQAVYVAGSHPTLGSWAAAGLKLDRGEDGRYHGRASMLSGIHQKFKVTRGSWSTVEVDSRGQDVPDREMIVDEDGNGAMTVRLAVAQWRDEGKAIPGRITTTGDLRMHERLFFSTGEHGDDPRNLVVYLPPGYDDDVNAQRRYPVLYVQDGQNLFDANASYAGVEWRADEAAQSLITAGTIDPLIIVAVGNTLDRDAEYTAPGVSAYGEQIVSEIKPFIDRTYRTLNAPGGTAIAGAHLGANAALLVSAEHPEAFGAVAMLSPMIGDADASLATAFNAAVSDVNAWADSTPVWIDMPTTTEHYLPDADPAAQLPALTAAIEAGGGEMTVRQPDNGAHTEAWWQQRFPDLLRWLDGYWR